MSGKRFGRIDANIVTGYGTFPIGGIIPWTGGYFANSSNGTFTNVLGNTIATANTYLNPLGLYVCDGTAINDSSSPIFNGASRFLPNLTDNRFLMGATTSGSVGGANTLTAHTHTLSNHIVTQPTFNIPAHYHGKGTLNIGTSTGTGNNSVDHTHNWGGNWSTDNSNSVTAPYGDGVGNTYEDAVGYWGVSATTTTTTESNAGIYYNASSSILLSYSETGNVFLNVGGLGGNQTHTHTYRRPAHRHYIQSRASAGMSVDHTHSFTVASTNFAGNVGNTGGSNGDAAFACAAVTASDVDAHSVTGTQNSVESRPVYLSVLYVIRIK